MPKKACTGPKNASETAKRLPCSYKYQRTSLWFALKPQLLLAGTGMAPGGDALGRRKGEGLSILLLLPPCHNQVYGPGSSRAQLRVWLIQEMHLNCLNSPNFSLSSLLSLNFSPPAAHRRGWALSSSFPCWKFPFSAAVCIPCPSFPPPSLAI